MASETKLSLSLFLMIAFPSQMIAFLFKIYGLINQMKASNFIMVVIENQIRASPNSMGSTLCVYASVV
jgi:hypothetical protein